MRFRPHIPISVAAVAALALVAAGCGGGGSPGVASITATTTATTTAQRSGLLAYSRCMRSHGVPSFPDPTSSEGIPKDEIPVGSPKFVVASSACEHLMPVSGLGPQESARQTSTRVADELSFARCMRSRGVTRFPDPTAQGELSIAMIQAQGIDPHSSAVLRIVRACLPASHGALTPAKVAQALHDAGA